MSRIIFGQIVIYLFLFLLISSDIKNIFLLSFNSLIIISSYIYLGFSNKNLNKKIWNYFILSYIGLLLFITALIISPNHIATKTIESSYIWFLLELYLAPFEWIRFVSKIESLRYASLTLYLSEIALIGILPYLGSLLKNKFKPDSTDL